MHFKNDSGNTTKEDALNAPVAPASEALTKNEGDTVQCLACAHQCHIKESHTGKCRIRFNRNGILYAPDGYVAGLQIDPIEKKPFYHVLPGSNALSFGMLGCNYHCSFCQNWMSSQQPHRQEKPLNIQSCSPSEIVDTAIAQNVPAIVSTYNEPLITADWAVRIFEKAKEKGLLCGFVSNGFASPTVLKFMRPVTDLYKVDLKCFTDRGYQMLGGRLHPVLNTIEMLAELGFWVEVVTLVVPGFNDSPKELADTAIFIAGISPKIPWHVTAFHPTYKMANKTPTSQRQLEHAYDAGKDAGLHYVYAGNMAGRVANREHTYCPHCASLLIERRGFHVLQNRLVANSCPDCNTKIPGRWQS
ncbi:MAG: AmmeMemoRadiSam system radical SAM enzyme [Candidatus Hydrogenedentes bacterium]|nr:AmmeMemoRadiSam system radical SAM enzyme [Candidatus Hydrogenedentota bacterium]